MSRTIAQFATIGIPILSQMHREMSGERNPDQLWYHRPDTAIGYAMYSSRSHDAVIRVYDATGNMIETLEHAGDFKEW